MPTDHNPEEHEELKVRYATDDPSPRGVAIAAAAIGGFVLFATAVAAALVAIPGVVPNTEAPKGPFARTVPPKGTPLLQTNITNTTDIRDLRQHEEAVMTTYGKTDASTPVGQTYRIPIDKAMQIIASDKSLDPTTAWLAQSSDPVPGQLGNTPAGPKADAGAHSMQIQPPAGTQPAAQGQSSVSPAAPGHAPSGGGM